MDVLGSAHPNTAGGGDSSSRYHLHGVSRALRLLNGLAGAGSEGLSLTEAAQLVDASKSTTFALLRTLVDLDYVSTFDRGPRYRLGPAVVHLADAYSGSLPWLEVARPVARALTERTRCTSRIASHLDGRPVFQERVDGPGVIRFFTDLGIREPPHISAAGKAILGCLPEDEVRRIVAETGLEARTRHTITDPDVLVRDVELARTRGFAVDDEEGDEGVSCIAAAFRTRDGDPLGAISITTLKSEMPAWRIHEFGQLVLAAANEIAGAPRGPARTPPRTP